MSERVVGRIEALYRYPVKSFAGERVERSSVERYGLYGDRSHAVVDETKQGWDRYMTARQLPDMLRYQAVFRGEAAQGAFPSLAITAPDGRQLAWGDPLVQELEEKAGRPLALLNHSPDPKELLAVDTGSTLIVTDRSLRRLAVLRGSDLDERRFRPNLVVALSGSETEETGWIGKRLTAGTAEWLVEESCERCSMINYDPDTLERDPALLRLVNEHMNLMFGVYASVCRTGEVRVGDEVRTRG